ncbi:MAG TPA: TIGR04283 family arsenosugar biosynthesis glycosyltransferase [Gammaproteobacteria bacterium]|nr:TIGR04283 family arsenosugar biosynthesis glycosyltransferase [Gammaproteobacteria bacterium]
MSAGVPQEGTEPAAASTGVAVVIPVLGEEHALGTLLARLARQRPAEVVVVSGRSAAAAEAVCRSYGCKYVETAPNRGAQLHAGALEATAPVLWFLHADAEPARDAVELIASAVRHGAESGCFRFAFQGPSSWYKRLLARLVALRIRCGGMVYGDQGIFARRDVYLELGGFAAQPLFEEVRLVRGLRARGRFRVLPRALAVATRRWERDGWLARTLHNRWLALRYALGGEPAALAASYRATLTSGGDPEP